VKALPWSRPEHGQASVELMGVLPVLLIFGLLAWQLLYTLDVAGATADAARTGSRAAGLGGDGRAAAMGALPETVRQGAVVEVNGEEVSVEVEVPLLVTSLRTGLITVSDSAELPATNREPRP